MKLKPVQIAMLTVLTVIMFSCATSANQLKSAQKEYDKGNYIESIEYALKSYQLAIKKNKKPEETAEAKRFLEYNFPNVVDILVANAKRADAGGESSQLEAWELWNGIVELNRAVNTSSAYIFLTTTDFSKELEEAKEVAAKIYYSAAEKKFIIGDKDSFKEAYELYSKTLMVIPGYLDANDKMTVSQEEAMTTYAIVISDIDYDVKLDGKEDNVGNADGKFSVGENGLSADLINTSKNYINGLDSPEFTSILGSVDSLAEAMSSEADIIVVISADVSIYSSAQVDDYSSFGIYKRYYDVEASITGINTNTNTSQENSINCHFGQDFSIKIVSGFLFKDWIVPLTTFANHNDSDWNEDQYYNFVKNVESNEAATFSFFGTLQGGKYIPETEVTVEMIDKTTMNGVNATTFSKLASKYGLGNDTFVMFNNQEDFTGRSGSIYEAMFEDMTTKLFDDNNSSIDVIKSEL